MTPEPFDPGLTITQLESRVSVLERRLLALEAKGITNFSRPSTEEHWKKFREAIEAEKEAAEKERRDKGKTDELDEEDRERLKSSWML